MEATVLDASEARRLILSGQAPAHLKVNGDLDFSNEVSLTWLPEGLEVGRLMLDNCSALEALPERMKVFVLDMPNCVSVQRLPDEGPEQIARLNVRGCTRISALPSWLKRVAQLDVSGCANLHELPEGDVSELRTRESTKRVRHCSPASFWMLDYQHHGRKPFQSVAEHLALLGKGNLLLQSGTDPKELTHFIEGSAET